MEKNANKVELCGYAGYTPEVIELNNGNKMVRFSLATSESYQNKNGEWVNDTTWHRVIMWNQMAEMALEHINKGVKMSLSGKINYRTYLDRIGNKHITTEIIANSFVTQKQIS